MLTIVSRYPSKCTKCGKPIAIGESMAWDRTAPRRQRGYHLSCRPEQDYGSNPETRNRSKHAEYEIKPIPLEEFINEMAKMQGKPDSPEPKPEPKTEEEIKTEKDFVSTEMLASVLKDFSKEIKRDVEKQLAAKIKPEPIEVVVKQESKPDIIVKNAHKNFSLLLKRLSQRKHTYLHGPHGSGKSFAARQAAEALGLAFGYLSLTPATPESRLLGYQDATGCYRGTVLYELYKNGGIFCLDEMDNTSAALQTTLNSALENGAMSFPGVGMVERHKDFVLVGTGNTSGRGANPSYPERRPFDSAFADRFLYIEWGYDETLERMLAESINPKQGAKVQALVSAMRAYAEKEMPRWLPSPRVTIKVSADLAMGLDLDIALEGAFFRGCEQEVRNKLINAAKTAYSALR